MSVNQIDSVLWAVNMALAYGKAMRENYNDPTDREMRRLRRIKSMVWKMVPKS